jgi:hypothetical protein
MAARRRDASGFALLEVVVAFALVVVVFFAIEYGVAQTTKSGVDATQLATEASLASQAIVQAEALPFADLQAGANLSQLTAALNGGGTALKNWPQVAFSGAAWTLTLPGAITVGTVLAANPATSGEVPVVPFSSATTLGKVTYKVAVFTTTVTGSANLVRVTAIVERVIPSSTSASTPCPSTPASANATTTLCGDLVQQAVLGPK